MRHSTTNQVAWFSLDSTSVHMEQITYSNLISFVDQLHIIYLVTFFELLVYQEAAVEWEVIAGARCCQGSTVKAGSDW